MEFEEVFVKRVLLRKSSPLEVMMSEPLAVTGEPELAVQITGLAVRGTLVNQMEKV